MINDKDRSGYIGASDTRYVMGGWNSNTFAKWWREKQGIYRNTYSNDAMKTGTAYEHKILDALNIKGLEKDKQIIRGRLRVNLDGNTPEKIYEVKTHSIDKPFKVSSAYRMQVNVEMYAFKIYSACIIAYALEEADYKNFYRDIDLSRITTHEIEYDEGFIQRYLQRLEYLTDCVVNGRFPNEKEL